MNGLIELRDNLRKIYAEYGFILRPVCRFITALLFLVLLRNYCGFSGKACGPAVLLGLSGLCIFFDFGAVSFVCALFLTANLFMVSYSACLFAVVFFMLILMLYFGLRPGNGIILFLVPICCILRIPYLLPVILALSGGFSLILPGTIGCLAWFLISYYKENSAVLTKSVDPEVLAKEFMAFTEGVFMNTGVYVMLMSFILCMVTVYLIRRLEIDHSWTIAVISGTVITAFAVFLGNYYFDIETNVLVTAAGLLAALLGGLLYELIFFNVDYKAGEKLQFEDDDYYYYVKAIPKVKPYEESERRE